MDIVEIVNNYKEQAQRLKDILFNTSSDEKTVQELEVDNMYISGNAEVPAFEGDISSNNGIIFIKNKLLEGTVKGEHLDENGDLIGIEDINYSNLQKIDYKEYSILDSSEFREGDEANLTETLYLSNNISISYTDDEDLVNESISISTDRTNRYRIVLNDETEHFIDNINNISDLETEIVNGNGVKEIEDVFIKEMFKKQYKNYINNISSKKNGLTYSFVDNKLSILFDVEKANTEYCINVILNENKDNYDKSLYFYKPTVDNSSIVRTNSQNHLVIGSNIEYYPVLDGINTKHQVIDNEGYIAYVNNEDFFDNFNTETFDLFKQEKEQVLIDYNLEKKFYNIDNVSTTGFDITFNYNIFNGLDYTSGLFTSIIDNLIVEILEGN